ncbi:DUF4911 domain-containing protein [Desulfoplanes sp.]
MKSSRTRARAGNTTGRAGRPLPPPAGWSDHLYVHIARSDIALFKFILESWDNLAYLSVLDKYRAMVRITFAPDSRQTVTALLHELGTELGIQGVIDMPGPHRNRD